ncbi:efflux RND transporter periplasmic adaptor subunit [Leptothrix ochracea]|uniref:efflux RND transporter periplasmic adaptor subunit n=1 Tax=Leptothrix ochracea TaxID=735331 RepID=UPI0034E2ED4A
MKTSMDGAKIVKIVKVVLLTPLLVHGLSACHAPEAEAPKIAPPVVQAQSILYSASSPQLAVIKTFKVQVQAQRDVELTGRLGWDEDHTSRITAPVAGRVLHLDVQAGQAVSNGHVLAKLSSPDFGQAQADAARARADVLQAQRTLDRARELEAAGAMARRELEAAQADRDRAGAEQARSAARLAGYGNAASGSDQLFALRSPISGWVVERNANIGQEVRPDQSGPGVPALFVISDPRRLWVNFDVPEGLAGQVRPGISIDLRLDALSNQATTTTQVIQVADSLDPQTRTLRVRAALPNPDRSLKAEMFVHGTLHLTTAEPQPMIPSQAVVLVEGKHYVFVQTEPGHFTRRQIQAEDAGIAQIRVRSGLKADEQIVTEGSLMLQQVLANAGVHG